MQADGVTTPALHWFKVACRAGAAGLAGLMLASCSTSSDPFAQLGLVAQPGYQPQIAEVEPPAGDDVAVAEDDLALPQEVAAAPADADATGSTLPDERVEIAAAATEDVDDAILAARMGTEGAYLETVPAVAAQQAGIQPEPQRRGFFSALFARTEHRRAPPTNLQQPTAAAEATEAPAQVVDAVPEAAPPDADETLEVASAESADLADVVRPTAYIENRPPEAVPQAPARRRGFLSAFFSNSEAAPQTERKPEPVMLAAAQPSRSSAAGFYSGEALPGVRDTDNLYEIKRKSGTNDHSDIDINENNDVELAMAPGFARLAPNGLTIQTDRVDVACLKPSLVRVLKAVEGHYGEKVVVTSGYRSPKHNRRARGSSNSLHMYCAAADIQVPGIGKWELAQFLRAMPGRGGVGTYCHTKSVHIDVGPERDWNWRCRRRKRK